MLHSTVGRVTILKISGRIAVLVGWVNSRVKKYLNELIFLRGQDYEVQIASQLYIIFKLTSREQ